MTKVMVSPKILLVSNLQTTLPLWVFNSLHQRLHVVLEPQPDNAMQCWSQETPDLVIFDVDPPESDAMDLIKELRMEAVTPILLLTANHTENLLLAAYEAGVDECILKPIHPMVFHAKLMAWLRRSGSLPGDKPEMFKVGNIQFIPMSRVIVFGDNNPIHLTNLEVRLLSYLMKRPGRTATIEELCQHLWMNGRPGDKVTLKNVVYRLRRKIESDPARAHCIKTIAGIGYQFVPEWVAVDDNSADPGVEEA